MNKRDKAIKRNKVIDLIDRSSLNGTKVNCAKYWRGTTYEHWRVMSDIIWKLASQGYETFTEVTFNNGARADILVIDNSGEGYVIEVLHTETDERFNLKLDSYPLPIIKVRTKGFNIDEWDL